MNRNVYVVEPEEPPLVVAGPFPDPREAAREAAEHEEQTGHETAVVAEDVMALYRRHGDCDLQYAEGVDR